LRNNNSQAIPVGHTTIGIWIANFVAENDNNYQKVMKKNLAPNGK